MKHNDYTDNFINFALDSLDKARNIFHHNPLDHHTSEYDHNQDPEVLNGSSVFEDYSRFKDPEGMVPYVMGAASEELKDIVPGSNGALVLIYGPKDDPAVTGSHIGWTSRPKINPTAFYKVAKIHGSLQLTTTEPMEEIIERTNRISFVFTPEKGVGFVLASIHPGDPDPIPDFDNLFEGDEITGEEAIRRGIVRVKKVD